MDSNGICSFMNDSAMSANVQAFVLLGTSSIRRPRRRLPNVVNKDKILFCCLIVNVKLGQKPNSVTAVERRFASHPNSTNALVGSSYSFFLGGKFGGPVFSCSLICLANSFLSPSSSFSGIFKILVIEEFGWPIM